MYIIMGIDFRRPGYKQRNHLDFFSTLADSQSALLDRFSSEEYLGLPVNKKYEALVKLLRKGMASPVTEADNLRVFTSGQEKLESLLTDIKAAKKYIYMEYFYFRKGMMGSAFREALMQKARGGVRVCFIRENIANFDIRPSYYNEMKKAGVEVVKFTPMFSNILTILSKLNYRDHRKIAIIDGKIAYTGGMNISDDYYNGWRDTHLRFTGEAVSALQVYFLDTYITSRGKISDGTFDELFPSHGDVLPHVNVETALSRSGQLQIACRESCDGSAESSSEAAQSTAMSIPVQLVPGDPDTPWSFLSLGLNWVLNNAETYVWCQTPYFMPPDSVLEAIKSAALRGVDVRIMLPKNADIALLTPINRSYYSELLRAGVRVFRNDGPFIHSKTFVCDDYLSMVGSCNMDNRSLELSYEMNTYMYSREMALRNKAIFEKDMEKCTEIFFEDCQKQSVFMKLIDFIFRLLAPLL